MIRLAQLQKHGDEDWRKRVDKPNPLEISRYNINLDKPNPHEISRYYINLDKPNPLEISRVYNNLKVFFFLT